MADPLTPAQLRAALSLWLPDRHRFYPGWEDRTRPGEIFPKGFIVHHTGGPFTHSLAYLEFLFQTGRPAEGIPGPLCNFAIDDLGLCWVGSIGRTNNAGAGNLATLSHVIAQDYPGYTSELHPAADNYQTGNREYWGVEIMYPGTVAMRAAQYETAKLLCAALMDAYTKAGGGRWTALSTVGHREHSERKWDPGNCSLSGLRRDVRDLLAAGPGEGDDVGTIDDTAANKAVITEAVMDALNRGDVWRPNVGAKEAAVELGFGESNRSIRFLAELGVARSHQAVSDIADLDLSGASIVDLKALAKACNDELGRRITEAPPPTT